MIIDLFLSVFFLAGVFLLWYRVSVKIPELIVIPDHVITERFHDDSARLRLFVLHIKSYYREGKHKLLFWKFVGKTLQRFHLVLLRVDNGTVAILQRVKAHGIVVNGADGISSNSEENYWQRVQEEEPVPASIPVATATSTRVVTPKPIKTAEVVRKPRRNRKTTIVQ